jgi:hypothetical protein
MGMRGRSTVFRLNSYTGTSATRKTISPSRSLEKLSRVVFASTTPPDDAARLLSPGLQSRVGGLSRSRLGFTATRKDISVIQLKVRSPRFRPSCSASATIAVQADDSVNAASPRDRHRVTATRLRSSPASEHRRTSTAPSFSVPVPLTRSVRVRLRPRTRSPSPPTDVAAINTVSGLAGHWVRQQLCRTDDHRYARHQHHRSVKSCARASLRLRSRTVSRRPPGLSVSTAENSNGGEVAYHRRKHGGRGWSKYTRSTSWPGHPRCSRRPARATRVLLQLLR